MEKHEGHLVVKAWTIIPVLLYVSKSEIRDTPHSKRVAGAVFTLHITPWFGVAYIHRG